MSNPMIQQQPSLRQAMQQLQANPIQILQQAGYQVPQNLSNPNDMIQHLMRSGQLTQAQYDQLYRAAQQIRM